MYDPAGIPVPLIGIPGCKFIVLLRFVTVAAPVVMSPVTAPVPRIPNGPAVTATGAASVEAVTGVVLPEKIKAPPFNCTPPVNVFAPDNSNVPLPSFINPAGFALNAFSIAELTTKLVPDNPDVVIVRFNPFKSSLIPLTVGTVA
jgi:hypothetical protein